MRSIVASKNLCICLSFSYSAKRDEETAHEEDAKDATS